MRYILFSLLLISIILFTVGCQMTPQVRYISSADNSQQPAVFYAPKTKKAVPLIVALHTWSSDYKQDMHKPIEEWCIKNDWAYIHPNFRGPNIRPEATGSELAVQDIVSAVEYVKSQTNIDESSIYLVGTSGGGYASLLMAGRHPEIWAAVSVWVPIIDLKAWYEQTKKAGKGYYKHIVVSCGGVPGDNPQVDKEYRNRSPLTYLHKAKGVNLHISAGIYDGHKGSVPISHSLLAFNEVAHPKDRISEEDIRYFVEKAQVPPDLKVEITDASYGEKKPLFRRMSGNATITIFDGRHEIVHNAAIGWIENVHKEKN